MESASENWKVYVNGEMVPWNEATISVFDRGFQYGDGVFEGMRCYDGLIFKLKEHTDRLFRSARAVHIQIPLSKDELNDAVKHVLRENGFRDAHVKPQITRGNAPKLGLDPRNTTRPNIVRNSRLSNPAAVETNIVMVDVGGTGLDSREFLKLLYQHGVRGHPYTDQIARFTFHPQIRDADLEHTLEAMRSVAAEAPGGRQSPSPA